MVRTLIIALILSINAFSNGGSNYSAFGIGDIFYSNGAAYEGQGGVSAAMPSEDHINLRNPALWSKNTKTLVQFGYDFHQGLADLGSDINYQTNSSISNFLILFSIDTSMGISAGMGIFRSSNVAYEVTSFFSENIEGISASGQLLQRGEGGLNTAYIGGSFEPIKNLSIGLMASYNFGNIKDSVETLFNQFLSFSNRAIRNDQLSGFNLRAGIYYSPIKNLSIGAFIETQSDLSVDSEVVFDNEGVIDSTINSDNIYQLPQMLGGGISYKLGRYRLGADFYQRDFTGFAYNSERSNLVNFTNSNGFSLGLVRYRKKNLGVELLERLTYRAGFGVNNLYYEIDGSQLSEIFLSAGFSAVIGDNSMFDYSFTLGTRGENRSPLFNETFIRMNFNISIGETWFEPFRKGYDDIED